MKEMKGCLMENRSWTGSEACERMKDDMLESWDLRFEMKTMKE